MAEAVSSALGCWLCLLDRPRQVLHEGVDERRHQRAGQVHHAARHDQARVLIGEESGEAILGARVAGTALSHTRAELLGEGGLAVGAKVDSREESKHILGLGGLLAVSSDDLGDGADGSLLADDI